MEGLITGISNVALALLALGMLVFIHELGHYIAARMCGVRVRVFSVGFGKELWARVDKNGTRWRIAVIPLGGYVRMLDDEHRGEVDKKTKARDRLQGAFYAQPLLNRAWIVFAGPLANFLAAIVALSLIYGVAERKITPPVIEAFQTESPAKEAGLAIGDRILSVNGVSVNSMADTAVIVKSSPHKTLAVGVSRNGQDMVVPVQPGLREVTDARGKQLKVNFLGVVGPDPERIRLNPLEAVNEGVSRTLFLSATMVRSIWYLVTGQLDPRQLSGPVGIVQVAGKRASEGVLAFLFTVAIISINLGLVNLLPIPILDGGHLTLFALEAIRRKPLNEKAHQTLFRVSLALLLGVFIFATFNDLV